MKRSLTALLALLLLLPVTGLAQAETDGDLTPLEEVMEEMSTAFRQLRRSVGDPDQNESSLALLATLKKGSEASLKFEPALAADQPEADRAAYIAEYRKGIQALIGLIDQTVAAINAGDNAGAEGHVRAMAEAQRTGHRKFRKPKD